MFTGLGFNVKDDFKKISRTTLNIKVKQLDFTEDGGRPAAEAINSWVSNKMNGKINEIISSGTPHTNIYRVNMTRLSFKLKTVRHYCRLPNEPDPSRPGEHNALQGALEFSL